MSQDATRQTFLNSTTNPSSAQPWGETFGSDVVTETGSFSVESYADRLMDELFEEVEQALDRGVELTEPPKPMRKPPEPAVVPPAAPTNSEPPALSFPLAATQPDAGLLLEAHQSITEANPVDLGLPVSEPAQESSRSYDRLLVGIGCISIILAIAIWLINQESKRQTVIPASIPSQTAPSPVGSRDAQFVDYVQQAIQAIEQRTQSPSRTTAVASAPTTALPNPTMPTVKVPPTTARPNPVVPPRPATGKLKVPVYPLPPSLFPSAGTAVAPIPRTAPAAPAPVPVQPPVPTSTPSIARKLTGIVDMGDDRSAVLIEINEVVQRFRIGESIGSSGWTLVEVSQNQAMIRRNGEVRSIFIGQSF